MSALATICREGPMSAGDVAAREGVKPPSATRVLAGLEAIGLITRTADPQDGRQVLLAASPEGQERLNADLRARDAWLARRIESLSDAERRRLQDALGVLQQLAEQ
jgi:DNA-binding MarR family transcriptional regulator